MPACAGGSWPCSPAARPRVPGTARRRAADCPDRTQPKVSPAEAGIDMAGIQAAVDYAAARNTRALVIGHGGHIVFEKYWDDTTLETPVDLSGIHPGADRAARSAPS